MNFRFWSHVVLKSDDECWMWTGSTVTFGHGRASRDGGANVLAHRFAYEQVYGPIPNGLCVLHACDTPGCVNPAHLHLGTQLDNIAECVARGRAARGERNGRAKLRVDDVRAIRGAIRRAVPHRVIAAAFGVCTKTVSRIGRRMSWKHIQKPKTDEETDA